MRKMILGAALCSLFLACSDPVTTVDPQKQNSKGSVFREVLMLTPSIAGRDLEPGTHITTFFQDLREVQGNQVHYHRHFDSVQAEGYFRRILFSEIAFKANLGLWAQGSQIQSVQGINTFAHDVMDTIRVSPFVRQDLQRPYFMSTLEPDLREWWVMTHLISGKFQLQSLVDSLKGRVVGRNKIDSVRVYEIESDDLGDCLHYTIWYNTPDTVYGGYLALQAFKTSSKLADETKGFKFVGAIAKVKHSIWVHPENGLPCREDMLRDYVIQMRDTVKDTSLRRQFPAQMNVSTVYRYAD